MITKKYKIPVELHYHCDDCKTELVMTGFASDWEHFFDLRSKGITGKPHPDIKVLADILLFQFTENKLI